ncbi:MAG: hypothetical protein ABI794_17095 [Betaproteobacteria bacterium]
MLLLLLASGCSVNMAAVRTFSAETRQLTQAVDVQVSDLDASCRRRVDRLELVRPPTPETVARYRQTCDQLAAASEIPRRYNTILAEYGKALGALADDQAATFTAELGEARDSVASLANAAGASGVGAGEIAAGTRVADLIAKVASSGARKRAVMEMLQRRDDVAALCAVLKRYLDPRYVGVLDNEAGALDGLTTDLERKYGDHEPIRTRELAREFEAAKGSLQAKRAGAEQTVEALDALVVSHGKLADGARHLDRDDVVESVHSYGKEVRDVFKQLRSAYAGTP